MPALSALKNSVLSALKSPHEGNHTRLGRRVISFDEALGNLKSAKTDVAPCAAFHRFGRCRKEIPLRESNFLTNLNQIDMNDVQTPIKLMPLMLCSTHWGKTIYNNALFLDWLSIYGSKKDNQHFENIVVDYQSAIAIDNEVPSLLSAPVSDNSAAGTQGRPASAPSSPVKEESHMNSPRLSPKPQINKSHTHFSFPEPPPDPSTNHVPEISVLTSMDSFASIELGAAKLEIIYQDDLKCIAMTSDGWRCQEIIKLERLLQARGLLNTSVVSDTKLDMDIFSSLVLCPGHAQGDLPSIYSEKWAAFSEQRLPKEKAMAKFDAEFWMSVEFFRNDVDDAVFSKSLQRPRSASHLRPRQNWEGSLENAGNTRAEFLPQPPSIPFVFRGSRPGSPSPVNETEPTSTNTASDSKSFGNKSLFQTETTENLSSKHVDLRSSAHTSYPTVLPLQFPKAKATSALDTPNTIDISTDDPDVASNSEPEDSSPSALGLFSNLRITDVRSQSFIKPAPPIRTFFDETLSMENQTSAQNLPPERITGKTTPSKEPTLPTIPSRSLNEIHNDIIQKIRLPNSQGGNVYVFKSLDGTLIRIGAAAAIQTPTSASQDHYCSLQALDQAEVEVIKVKHFAERVLSLVYLELANFRVQATCQHGTEDLGEEEHRKWFKVPGVVALQSVRLWRDFVDQAYTSEGSLRGDWAPSYMFIPPPTSREYKLLQLGLNAGDESALNVHHALRHKRYESWISDWRTDLLRDPEDGKADKQSLRLIPVRLPGQNRTTKVIWHKKTPNRYD